MGHPMQVVLWSMFVKIYCFNCGRSKWSACQGLERTLKQKSASERFYLAGHIMWEGNNFNKRDLARNRRCFHQLFKWCPMWLTGKDYFLSILTASFNHFDKSTKKIFFKWSFGKNVTFPCSYWMNKVLRLHKYIFVYVSNGNKSDGNLFDL